MKQELHSQASCITTNTHSSSVPFKSLTQLVYTLSQNMSWTAASVNCKNKHKKSYQHYHNESNRELDVFPPLQSN